MATKIYVWKDAHGIALAAVITLWAQIGFRILQLLLSVILGAGGDYSQAEEFTAPQLLTLLVDLLAYLSLFAGIIVCGIWVFRAVSNAHVIHPRMNRGPWGAILYYFVPFASLFIPCQAIGELWRVSAGPQADRKAERIVGWWWGFYLASNLVAYGSVFAAGAGPGTAIMFNVLNYLLLLPSAYLYLRIVQSVTKMQAETYAAGVFGDSVTSTESVLERMSY